jgi:hypothetical protein
MKIKLFVFALFFFGCFSRLWAQEEAPKDSTEQASQTIEAVEESPSMSRADSIRAEKRRLAHLRDSVAMPPMSVEELKTAFQPLRYEADRLRDYDEMKKRLADLEKLRNMGSWIVKRLVWEGAKDAEKKAMRISYDIRKSCAILSNEVTILEENKGKSAMLKFKSLSLNDIYNEKTQQTNLELLNELKTNLFFSKQKPNIISQGGVGKLVNPDMLEKGIHPHAACKGYSTTLGADFNLMILRLSDGKTIAVISDKNADSKTFGTIRVF